MLRVYEYNSYDYEYRPWWALGACIECVHTDESAAWCRAAISPRWWPTSRRRPSATPQRGLAPTSGGAIALSAEQGILPDAQTVEVKNQNQTHGLLGVPSAYGSEQTCWNNFTTQLSQPEGGSITAAAKPNLTGIRATLASQTDLALSADRMVTFEAEQNEKYLSQSGRSFGWGFKGLTSWKPSRKRWPGSLPARCQHQSGAG